MFQGDTYESMLTLLIEMSDRPTAVLDMTLGTTEYSPNPDDEDSSGSDSEETLEMERKREEFRKEVVNDLLETRLDVNYSSDSDLSVIIYYF